MNVAIRWYEQGDLLLNPLLKCFWIRIDLLEKCEELGDLGLFNLKKNVLFVLLRNRLTMCCGIESIGKILSRRGDLELVKLLEDCLITVHLRNLHCIFVIQRRVLQGEKRCPRVLGMDGNRGRVSLLGKGCNQGPDQQ